MPYFVMIGHDGPDSDRLRAAHREAHVAHVSALNDAGRIACAGPIKSDDGERSTGAVIIFEAGSLDEARQLVDRDPYVIGGVFETFSVNLFRVVFPEPK